MASKALELQAWHAQMDMICDQYADAIAERDAFKARALTAEERASIAERKLASTTSVLDMYAKAWQRELRAAGKGIINKSHEIDALVLTTKMIVEIALKADPVEAKKIVDKAYGS